MPAFESMKSGYANRSKYEAVTHETGVPWKWISCAHHREHSSSFTVVEDNGNHIMTTFKAGTGLSLNGTNDSGLNNNNMKASS